MLWNDLTLNVQWSPLLVYLMAFFFFCPFIGSVSDCPSLMHGIFIQKVNYCQAMLERGVYELAHSFFHYQKLYLIRLSNVYFFMPPLKKRAYCFATVGRSLGRSVCRPCVLLTPSLDQYQTWCRGCHRWVDDPYWFSRSHVQRSRSDHSFDPTVLSAHYLLTPSSIPNLVQGLRPISRWSLLIFRSKSNHSFEPNV